MITGEGLSTSGRYVSMLFGKYQIHSFRTCNYSSESITSILVVIMFAM